MAIGVTVQICFSAIVPDLLLPSARNDFGDLWICGCCWFLLAFFFFQKIRDMLYIDLIVFF